MVSGMRASELTTMLGSGSAFRAGLSGVNMYQVLGNNLAIEDVLFLVQERMGYGRG